MNVFEKMRRELPPAFYRTEVSKLIPGENPKSLANYDSAGMGPRGAVKIGRKVLYDRDGFIDWLMQKAGEVIEDDR